MQFIDEGEFKLITMKTPLYIHVISLQVYIIEWKIFTTTI